MILEDYPTGCCFVLRDLLPTGFSKKVMILQLKIHPTSKIFGKICLKAIRNTFFFNIYLVTWWGARGL